MEVNLGGGEPGPSAGAPAGAKSAKGAAGGRGGAEGKSGGQKAEEQKGVVLPPWMLRPAAAGASGVPGSSSAAAVGQDSKAAVGAGESEGGSEWREAREGVVRRGGCGKRRPRSVSP